MNFKYLKLSFRRLSFSPHPFLLFSKEIFPQNWKNHSFVLILSAQKKSHPRQYFISYGLEWKAQAALHSPAKVLQLKYTKRVHYIRTPRSWHDQITNTITYNDVSKYVYWRQRKLQTRWDNKCTQMNASRTSEHQHRICESKQCSNM